MSYAVWRFSALTAVCVVAACTGAVGREPQGEAGDDAAGGATPIGGGRAGAGGSGGAPAACNLGSAPLRRLSRFEYDNAVRDLLGDDSAPARGFPAEVGGNGFGNDANALDTSRVLVEQYFNAAQTLADKLTRDGSKLRALAGCDPASGEEPCASEFIARFGLRAYRRPVTADERDRLLALYRAERADGDFAGAIAAVIATMLQAPQFLYRIESTAPGQRLSSYELASRLSFLLWGSVPDESLLRAAASGGLDDASVVATEARRLLNDPRARAVTEQFHRVNFRLVGLEGLSRDRALHPRWQPGIGSKLAEEARRFIEHVVWQGEGDLATMLNAPYTMMDAELAGFYGVPAPAGTGWQKVSLDPARRAGIVTAAGPLTLLTPGAHTNPVKRGVFVRERVLCDPPPAPPVGLKVEPPPPNPNLSTRDSFAEHSNNPSCQGCHELIDPIGFAFETYDTVGLWRDDEGGKPIETKGELKGTDAAGPFDNASQLMARIARSGAARRCYVRSWFSFGYGRGETDDDVCTVDALTQAFSEANGNVRELLVGLTQTPAFLRRGTP